MLALQIKRIWILFKNNNKLKKLKKISQDSRTQGRRRSRGNVGGGPVKKVTKGAGDGRKTWKKS